jgi:hypothetical protein
VSGVIGFSSVQYHRNFIKHQAVGALVVALTSCQMFGLVGLHQTFRACLRSGSQPSTNGDRGYVDSPS